MFCHELFQHCWFDNKTVIQNSATTTAKDVPV